MSTEEAGAPLQPASAAQRPPILNRLFDLPNLDETPELRWARPANHMQRRVARGGVLYRDEERLGFVPRGIDRLLGARAMSWELSSITDVSLKPGLRKLRVTVITPQGRQRFIVSNPAVVWGDLNAWLRTHGDRAHPDRVVPMEGQEEEGGASA